uniref:Uncharacterized protein n=1 Tax=Arundo donax TaxID=35708 RepID=A0A0A9ERN5_ARUDO
MPAIGAAARSAPATGTGGGGDGGGGTCLALLAGSLPIFSSTSLPPLS